ncbi:MAG TPA: aspartate ammonia-lyase, partial [bacterium]|nr:aspartate ammonia-lyase [bacterium]
NAASLFASRAIEGIEANEERCTQDVEKSLALATALVPKVGYAKAAEIAKAAAARGKTVRETALEEGVASESELERLFETAPMTCGG